MDHRLSAGRLVLVHRGVYAIGCARPIGNGRLMAAVLAFGDGALVSHRNAGALWGFAPYAGPRIDVTAAGRGGRPGITLHRARNLHVEDRAVRDGIPVTSGRSWSSAA